MQMLLIIMPKTPRHHIDSKLIFENHLNILTTKTNKTIELLHELQNLLRKVALTMIYKTFVRPNLDYADIPYDQASNFSFHQKLESIQCCACLTIIGAM